MTLFGKPVSSYFRFAAVPTLLVVAVGVTRLILSLSGMPDTQTRWLSMTIAMMIAVIYLSVRIHTSGFGGFLRLLPVVLIPNTASHLVSIAGIVIGIATGQANVFTAPEFAFGQDGKTWSHVGAHLGLGMTAGGLVTYIVACLTLLITKLFSKLLGGAARSASTAR
jgi:hypothetical protein